MPAWDGAGVVEAVGSAVKDFRAEDRVVTFFAPKLASSRGDNALATMSDVREMLGHGTDGTLRSRGVFPETALVHAPKTLDWLPAGTLACNWPTAWNALFGMKGREARSDSFVLVQGTGGLSMAALQLAIATGATVIATTSTDDKAARLKDLGVAYTINYKTNPNWAEEARGLTPDKRGFDFVLDVGGNETLPRSLAAARIDGLVLILGLVGKEAETVPMIMAMLHTCVVRGVMGGSRNHLKELVRFIDEKKIVPVIDEVVFELADAKEAYKRLEAKEHFSKVVIRIDHPED